MLQLLNVFLVVRGPELDTGLEVYLPSVPSTGGNHCLGPVGQAGFDTGQDAISFLPIC